MSSRPLLPSLLPHMLQGNEHTEIGLSHLKLGPRRGPWSETIFPRGCWQQIFVYDEGAKETPDSTRSPGESHVLEITVRWLPVVNKPCL